jgi:hypothetical protein
MEAHGRTAGEEHFMLHATRATIFAALLGLALNGPAGPSRLLADLQVWLTTLWSDEGGLMDSDGLQGDEGSIMDPDG